MKFLKLAIIILVTVAITALAIDASDTISGKSGTLLAQLSGFQESVCPEGMVHVTSALTFSCVDMYEAAADKNCPTSVPKNILETANNISQPDCLATNGQNLEPWRNISREQASIMCARSGKRLPSAEEWYQFSLGTPADKCNISDTRVVDGNLYNECISAVAVRNTVGNVWEWVNDDVIDGMYKGRSLPETGYVTQVDNGGVATDTNKEKGEDLFNEDYFWTNLSGAYAMIRGGFYGSKSDAGVYSIHAHTLPTFTSNAVGFRCVR
jgi:formylglycine-generating enzyme required for sulfatase activity